MELDEVEGQEPDAQAALFINALATEMLRVMWNDKALAIYADVLTEVDKRRLEKAIFTCAHFCWYNRYTLKVRLDVLRKSSGTAEVI